MPYLVDSDVFIQAKDRHYGFDICPAFWDWLIASNIAGTLFSVEKIKDELVARADPLGVWAAARGAGFFLPPDAAVTASMQAVSTWATANGYTAAAQAAFLAAGDYYLISHAHAHGCIVVTHEVAAVTPNKVKIPTACAGLGVQCINPFQMLRAEGATFVLGAAAAGAASTAVFAPPAGAAGGVAQAGVVVPAGGQASQ